METVKQILAVLPDARPPFSFRIDNLGIETCVIKIKKIACKALKGKGVNTGLRLVYAHFKKIEKVEENGIVAIEPQEERIVFIELYHKKDKANEDRARIKKYFS